MSDAALDRQYVFRRGVSMGDVERLEPFFNAVFSPSKVGDFALTLTRHFPGVGPENWFLAEEKGSGEVAAAFALLPWDLEWEEVVLKGAEMGIVGTAEKHRGRGLMHRLNAEFDRFLDEEGYDLAIIQGIPGFYGQYGYRYALPLEAHINLALHAIDEKDGERGFSFRLAGDGDIPFLVEEDAAYRQGFALAARRDVGIWGYLLNQSKGTEYGSEFWLLEREEQRYYCRVPLEGFGSGLIVSEVSQQITAEALEALLVFCKKRALERDKPYIRFNLHEESPVGRLVAGRGAQIDDAYAWQVKVPDRARLLRRAKPLLERRLADSAFAGYSGRLRLDFFRDRLDLVWRDGQLEGVEAGAGECDARFCLNGDHFAAFCLGYRTWRELRYVQPDIFPGSKAGGGLAEVLFAKRPAWLHQQY